MPNVSLDHDGDPEARRNIEDGIALCLSGGGYRAMLFHLGSLWRLNEAGILPNLSRISSVSGGSITSATLALHWEKLAFDGKGIAKDFKRVVDAVRGMAGVTIDRVAILGGIFLPGTISDRVAKAYDEHLFNGASLQDIPKLVPGKSPRFVINATNIQTGALWRFSGEYMADYRVGRVDLPSCRLAEAVAASSAFPPVLSPMQLGIQQNVVKTSGADLHRAPFTTNAVLSDGGVYDNLGLETTFKRYRTLLVSNGGGKMMPEKKPASDWPRHVVRVLGVIDNQVRSLRKRELIDAFEKGEDHDGTYWGIATDFADYGLNEDPLGCAARNPESLATTPTRLKAMDDVRQEQLINWGYAVADAALRRHVGSDVQQRYGIAIGLPLGFPYARGY